MIAIIKNGSLGLKTSYSLYINDTHKIDFDHIREPEDLAQLLRDAANAIDLSTGVIQPKKKPKLSMMQRLNGIHHHLEKQNMDH